MAQITVEEVYRGDKYDVLGKVIKELFECGLAGEDLHTRIELLIVKHTLAAAYRMLNEGDFASELADAESLSYLSGADEEFIAGFEAGEAIANHIKMRISNSESEGNDHDNT